MAGGIATTVRRNEGHHNTDTIAQKAEHETEAFQAKIQAIRHKSEPKQEHRGPAGGLDDTPIPSAPPGYTVKFTFHRANALPFADFNSLSSDPYVEAVLYTKMPSRHKHDPNITFRTSTIRRNVDPVWEEEWTVANVPRSGFALKARIWDEDPADHNDRLGNVHVIAGKISDDWEGIKEQAFKIKKRMGSKRAYFVRGCAAMLNRNLEMSGELVMSVQALGRTQSEYPGQMYTLEPCNWRRHYSPMIGRIAGTKEPGQKGKSERYNFQANQIQLAGPVPPELYHRYVEFRPWIGGMFTSTSLKGRLLNRALHHQHARIYNYDRSTLYGRFPSPCKDLTRQFLDLCHYDKGGRMFTYIITLDGQWRFTETGKEFGIDMLSKHSMHSNCDIYIAYSGEFFIRRIKHSHESGTPDEDEQKTASSAEFEGGPSDDDPPKDPEYYSLIIDNDSGTYRPSAKLLPQLKAFLEHSLPGIKITTLDCQADEEKMKIWKGEQVERKKAEGSGTILVQGDDSSISSSEASDLDQQERMYIGAPKMGKKEKLERKIKRKRKAEERQDTGRRDEFAGEIREEKAGGRPVDAVAEAEETAEQSGKGAAKEGIMNEVNDNAH